MPDRQPYAQPAADPVRGMGLVILGFAVIVLADVAAKWTVAESGASMGLVTRGLFGALTVAVLARGRGLVPVNRPLLALRGLVHGTTSTGYYTAWGLGMPLGATYVLGSAVPLLMTVLAIPMLGEQVGWRRWTSTLVGLVGVMLILRPGGDLWHSAAMIVLFCVIGNALSRIWTRTLSRTDTAAAITFWLMVAQVPVGLLTLPFFPPPRPLWSAEWTVLAAMALNGVMSGAAHFLFSRGFALAPVSVLAPLEYTPVLLGMVVGFLVWSEVPAWMTLAGAAVIISAGLYNLYRERVRAHDASAEPGGAAAGATTPISGSAPVPAAPAPASAASTAPPGTAGPGRTAPRG